MSKKIALAVLVAVVSALGITVAFALSMNMGDPYGMYGPQQNTQFQPETTYNSMMGGSMMGGPSMMGGATMGMGPATSTMGCGTGGGMTMMGGPYDSGLSPIGMETAEQLAHEYLVSLNNPDLEIDELEEYSNNYYVSFRERSTGRGAFEIIIDRFYGTIHPEPQSMMWNLKYGMMGSPGAGMMTVTPEMAMEIAQQYLDVAYPGTQASSIMAYYGYYTIMTTLDGQHYGMLSVNGYTGQVWYHTWHGMFIGESEG